MICHKQALCSSTRSFFSGVLAQSGEAVTASTMEQGILGGFHVLLLSLPRLQHARLEGTAVGEREPPGLCRLVGVDGVKVDGGDNLRLASGEEGDPGDCNGEGALERGDGRGCNVLGGVLLGAADSREHHVRFEEGALQVDVVVAESLVDGCEGPLGRIDAGLEVVVAVRQDLRLHDGAEAVHLADAGVAGQDVGVLPDRELRGLLAADFQNAAPLGKAGTSLVVLLAALSKSVEPLGGRLIVRAQQLHDSLVHLDARDDALVLEELHKGGAIIGLLEERLVEENYSAEVLCHFLKRNDMEG